jgi:cyclohexanone monooxygenase
METNVDAVILGAGICGIGAAIALERAGVTDVVLLEKAGEIGGTWRDNTYPGCAVDIPAPLYSFSFAPNPDWSRMFCERAEILDYIRRVATDHGVIDRVRLRTEVLAASWDEDDQRWVVETNDGAWRARFLIAAAGPLHVPVIPEIPGLADFKGPIFHSSRWEHELDFTCKRVAVIGTGASATQFVPALQREAASVTVFQRTPQWIVPRVDWRTTRLERWLYRRVPALQRLSRRIQWALIETMTVLNHYPRLAAQLQWIGRAHLRRSIGDRSTRRALTPEFTIGCKRVAISNTYYRALSRPNVTLVPGAVTAAGPGTLTSADGAEHAADVIILGTGFNTTDQPHTYLIRGRGGVSLAEAWDGSPKAYLGTSVTGFPNLFTMFGPNIGIASGFVMLEAQMRYIQEAIQAMRALKLETIDVRPEVQEGFCTDCDERLAPTTWNRGGCSSYYIDANGRNAMVWPGTMRSLTETLSRFEARLYETTAVADRDRELEAAR